MVGGVESQYIPKEVLDLIGKIQKEEKGPSGKMRVDLGGGESIEQLLQGVIDEVSPEEMEQIRNEGSGPLDVISKTGKIGEKLSETELKNRFKEFKKDCWDKQKDILKSDVEEIRGIEEEIGKTKNGRAKRELIEKVSPKIEEYDGKVRELEDALNHLTISEGGTIYFNLSSPTFREGAQKVSEEAWNNTLGVLKEEIKESDVVSDQGFNNFLGKMEKGEINPLLLNQFMLKVEDDVKKGVDAGLSEEEIKSLYDIINVGLISDKGRRELEKDRAKILRRQSGEYKKVA